jgi:hypothetical protein
MAGSGFLAFGTASTAATDVPTDTTHTKSSSENQTQWMDPREWMDPRTQWMDPRTLWMDPR